MSNGLRRLMTAVASRMPYGVELSVETNPGSYAMAVTAYYWNGDVEAGSVNFLDDTQAIMFGLLRLARVPVPEKCARCEGSGSVWHSRMPPLNPSAYNADPTLPVLPYRAQVECIRCGGNGWLRIGEKNHD